MKKKKMISHFKGSFNNKLYRDHVLHILVSFKVFINALCLEKVRLSAAAFWNNALLAQHI